jgi:hypothetical protein
VRECGGETGREGEREEWGERGERERGRERGERKRETERGMWREDKEREWGREILWGKQCGREGAERDTRREGKRGKRERGNIESDG